LIKIQLKLKAILKCYMISKNKCKKNRLNLKRCMIKKLMLEHNKNNLNKCKESFRDKRVK